MKLPASFTACSAVLVFRDISQRRQIERDRAILLDHEREARAEVERLVARQRHLHSVTDTALSARALDELVPELLARLRVARRTSARRPPKGEYCSVGKRGGCACVRNGRGCALPPMEIPP